MIVRVCEASEGAHNVLHALRDLSHFLPKLVQVNAAGLAVKLFDTDCKFVLVNVAALPEVKQLPKLICVGCVSVDSKLVKASSNSIRIVQMVHKIFFREFAIRVL
eukprot:Skav214385  [mRNA]  locus=scaffold333:16829:21169:+ [translate_table: standard]